MLDWILGHKSVNRSFCRMPLVEADNLDMDTCACALDPLLHSWIEAPLLEMYMTGQRKCMKAHRDFLPWLAFHRIFQTWKDEEKILRQLKNPAESDFKMPFVPNWLITLGARLRFLWHESSGYRDFYFHWMGCYSSAGYFPAFGQVTPTIRRYPFINLGGERHWK